MKDYLKKLVGVVKDFREGDRIMVNGDVDVKTSVYKRSKMDDPYLSVDYKGGFSLTLIELILIVAAASVAVTLAVLWVKKKITSLFKRKREE
ncbi:MAG: hypothetical protein IKV54_08115 [Clostridia bacterium]|nr:hypothetical protein [Clostridia bacterium]